MCDEIYSNRFAQNCHNHVPSITILNKLSLPVVCPDQFRFLFCIYLIICLTSPTLLKTYLAIIVTLSTLCDPIFVICDPIFPSNTFHSCPQPHYHYITIFLFQGLRYQVREPRIRGTPSITFDQPILKILFQCTAQLAI